MEIIKFMIHLWYVNLCSMSMMFVFFAASFCFHFGFFVCLLFLFVMTHGMLKIKLLLEVIYKIVCKDKSVASKDNEKTIKNIHQEWSKKISHPYSDSIGKFFPSQQIQWISYKCIEKFSNC